MGDLNEKSAVASPARPPWLPTLSVSGIGAVCLFVAVVIYPAGFDVARMLIVQPISSAAASEGEIRHAPMNARNQQVASATTASHGTFVKDPYGCVYVYQYIAAQLSLMPMMDEHNQQICHR